MQAEADLAEVSEEAASAADVDAIAQAFKALAGVADSAEAATADAPALADWSLKLRASALSIGADAASGTPGLDGVTDPRNLGACLRSADGAGVDAVIAPKDHAAPLPAGN